MNKAYVKQEQERILTKGLIEVSNNLKENKDLVEKMEKEVLKRAEESLLIDKQFNLFSATPSEYGDYLQDIINNVPKRINQQIQTSDMASIPEAEPQLLSQQDKADIAGSTAQSHEPKLVIGGLIPNLGRFADTQAESYPPLTDEQNVQASTMKVLKELSDSEKSIKFKKGTARGKPLKMSSVDKLKKQSQFKTYGSPQAEAMARGSPPESGSKKKNINY